MGSWKERLRRTTDAALALAMPGGRHVAPVLFQVDGYLYPHEAVYLFWLARTAPGEANVIEVGSFRGRSTLCLAAGARQGGRGRVHAVDPHLYGTLDELRENVKRFGLAAQVEIVPERSVEVAARWRRPVQAVFIDGDHAREAVEADVRAWLPHVAPGGLLLLHDSTELSGFDGPRQVARDFCRVGEVFEAVGTLGGMTWARRRGGGTTWRPPEHGRRWLDRILRLRLRDPGRSRSET
jgi:predicted O-methyltransferase YrrM